MSKLHILWLFIFLVGMLSSSARSASVETNADVARIAFSSYKELRIIGADIDGDEHFRWAAWSETSAQGSVVKLALVENQATGPVVLQSIERKDAYEPELKRIIDWQFGKHPILALSYRQGAAAEQTELYGLDQKNRPVLLEERLGEVMTWGIAKNGKTSLGIYNRPDSQLVPTWFQWQEKSHALQEYTADPVLNHNHGGKPKESTGRAGKVSKH